MSKVRIIYYVVLYGMIAASLILNAYTCGANSVLEQR